MGLINSVTDSYDQYCSRIERKKNYFHYAKETSRDEIFFQFRRLKEAKNKKDLLRSVVKLTNSSVWVSRSGLSLFKSYFRFKSHLNLNHNNSASQEILSAVINNKSLDVYSDAQIFKTIYDELSFAHLHKNYKCSLKIPQINQTIVLVSGVFNELFSTPAFKRGAEKLLDDYHIKHIAPAVDGRKGAKDNALKLKAQIDHYIEVHPEESLWFFCFSKGGIDTLHYLKDQKNKLPLNIKGASFIATPLLGTDHINHKGLKILNTVAKVPEAITHRLFSKRIDPILKDLQKSLAKNYRENWFKRNHKELPSHLFYTALAFESKWHQSHIYMMATKALFKSGKANDGVVDVENAQFPNYFKGINLGVLNGHHLVGSRSSFYDQEALMKAHLIFLHYKIKQI